MAVNGWCIDATIYAIEIDTVYTLRLDGFLTLLLLCPLSFLILIFYYILFTLLNRPYDS
mgnify:CR=1 FL=1